MNEKLINENFVDVNSELTTKGHIACNINQINCLVLSEIISDGLFDDIDIKGIICILSCLTNCNISDNDRIISLKSVDIPENVKDVVKKSEIFIINMKKILGIFIMSYVS